LTAGGGTPLILRINPMPPDAYEHVLVASVAGGVIGVLVMWNRKRSQIAGDSKVRRYIVLILGTAACACAVWAFSKTFGDRSPILAATVMILMTGWAALLHSVMPLPLPRFGWRVRAGEFAILRAPWTAVRLFGAILHGTPIRHLGGRVYLAEAGRDPQTVLRGILDAETVHLWALVLSSPWLVFWGVQGRWICLICGLAVHVPLNVYPILHLRYVTWRIERYIARMRCTEKAKP
jgi:hypothetical protein